MLKGDGLKLPITPAKRLPSKSAFGGLLLALNDVRKSLASLAIICTSGDILLGDLFLKYNERKKGSGKSI